MSEIVDTTVRLPTDGANGGSYVDHSEVTRTDDTVVVRERIVLSSPSDPELHAEVLVGGAYLSNMAIAVAPIPVDASDIEVLIWTELRAIRRGIEMMLREDIEDETYVPVEKD